VLSLHCTDPKKRTSLSPGERGQVEQSGISSGLTGMSKAMCLQWHKDQVWLRGLAGELALVPELSGNSKSREPQPQEKC